MPRRSITIIEGSVVGELTLRDLAQACDTHADWIMTLVDEGILAPRGTNKASEWRFEAASLQRALAVRRLQRDLSLNLAGAALVLDMRDQIQRLQHQLELLEKRGLRLN